MVPIWRSTQAGRTVLLFQALLLRLGLRLVSDNTDLSGAEIHRVTAKHNPSQNRGKEEGEVSLWSRIRWPVAEVLDGGHVRD